MKRVSQAIDDYKQSTREMDEEIAHVQVRENKTSVCWLVELLTWYIERYGTSSRRTGTRDTGDECSQ